MLHMLSSYSLLPQNEHSTQVQEYAYAKDEKIPSTNNKFQSYALLVISACCVIDALALLYFAFWVVRVDAPIKLEDLPLRHTYASLDVIYNGTGLKSDAHGPIINLPLTFALVDQSRPRQILHQSSEMWMSKEGPVPAGDRRLLVASRVSTIMQLHVMDYGMENCSVTFQGPSAVADRPMNGTRGSIHGSRGDSALVDVWALVAPRKLDLSSMTWNTKPPRESLVGSLRVAHDALVQLDGFHCPTGSYQTFEVACSSEDAQCQVDLTIPSSRKFGLYMKQYQTT